MTDEPLRHWLVVADEYDDDGGGLELEHDPRCPIVQQYEGVDQYDCAVAFEVHNCGLEFFFHHRDDPDSWPYAERLDPGRYEIEVWSERHAAGPWGPEEYEGGLRTVSDSPSA